MMVMMYNIFVAKKDGTTLKVGATDKEIMCYRVIAKLKKQSEFQAVWFERKPSHSS